MCDSSLAYWPHFQGENRKYILRKNAYFSLLSNSLIVHNLWSKVNKTVEELKFKVGKENASALQQVFKKSM